MNKLVTNMVVVRPAYENGINSNVLYNVAISIKEESSDEINEIIKKNSGYKINSIRIKTYNLKYLFARDILTDVPNDINSEYHRFVKPGDDYRYMEFKNGKDIESFNTKDIYNYILRQLKPSKYVLFARLLGSDIIKFRKEDNREHTIQ